jgi:hypothetical protein
MVVEWAAWGLDLDGALLGRRLGRAEARPNRTQPSAQSSAWTRAGQTERLRAPGPGTRRTKLRGSKRR